MLSDHIKYSLKNIQHRKLRSWLTMIGIFIGIAAVVSLIGLGEGLKAAITGQFGMLAPDILRISPGGFGQGGPPSATQNPLDAKLVGKIENLKEIKSAAGRLTDFGKAEYNGKIAFGVAMSMPDGDARELIRYTVNYEAGKGRLLKDGDTGVIVIGANVANKDTFGKEVHVSNTVKINDKSFRVIGILKKKDSFMVDGTVMMNEDDHRRALDRESNIYDMIAARINPSYSTESAQASVERLMRKERNVRQGEEDFEVVNPKSVIESINSTMFAVQLFVYIIAFISIIVGGIGIMTTMYTAVIERTKEIGIMKAIGATNKTIFILFFIESGFMGMTGGIIGVILGFALAHGLAAAGRAALGFELLQASISIYVIIGSLIFSFLLGTVFGTYPAYKAAKMHPVDAMRFVK